MNAMRILGESSLELFICYHDIKYIDEMKLYSEALNYF